MKTGIKPTKIKFGEKEYKDRWVKPLVNPPTIGIKPDASPKKEVKK